VNSLLWLLHLHCARILCVKELHTSQRIDSNSISSITSIRIYGEISDVTTLTSWKQNNCCMSGHKEIFLWNVTYKLVTLKYCNHMLQLCPFWKQIKFITVFSWIETYFDETALHSSFSKECEVGGLILKPKWTVLLIVWR